MQNKHTSLFVDLSTHISRTDELREDLSETHLRRLPVRVTPALIYGTSIGVWISYYRSRCTVEIPQKKMEEASKLTVAALVFLQQADRLLLVKQEYGQQYWSLPGGVVEPGESIDQAAIREVKEETSLDCIIENVVGLYSKPRENALAITLAGKITGGEFKADHEVLECRFFPFDQLPTHVRAHFHQRVNDYQYQSLKAILRTQ